MAILVNVYRVYLVFTRLAAVVSNVLGQDLTAGRQVTAEKPMLRMRVDISRYVDGSFPGWVECTLVDAYGDDHVFVEKVPVVTKAHLDAASSYPQSGVIACVVLGSGQSDNGRRLVHIDTQTPWGVQSLAGTSRFYVFPEQLVAELEFTTLEVPGSDAVRLLEQYRSKYHSTGQYPFLIGDGGELERLEQEAEDAEQAPAEVIRASLEIDLGAWTARRHEEWREDAEVSDEELLGEWPIELAKTGSISLHKDIVSGKIKPKVYLGLAEIEQPWQLPAVIHWAVGMSAHSPRSIAPSIARGRNALAPRSRACRATPWNVWSGTRQGTKRPLWAWRGNNTGTATTSWIKAVDQSPS